MDSGDLGGDLEARSGSIHNPSVRTLKITLAYDGTAYVGWQRQAAGTSIQGLLEAAIARIEGEAVTVTGAGRTDAGVHALGQVASVAVPSAASSIGCDAYARALNASLPDDVRVRVVEEVGGDFHARFSARSKTYRYRLTRGGVASPFESRYAWHVTHALDVAAMRAALDVCRGEHDFAAFQSTGTPVRDTVRTMLAASITEVTASPQLGEWGHSPHKQTERPPFLGEGGSSGMGKDGELLIVELTGTGFLRHMVRAITGTLVEIGRGRWPPAEMAAILASRDRSRAGPTAPPQGLFLVHVDYSGV
jgi:tRNA pseudouridine38-40 synthase